MKSNQSNRRSRNKGGRKGGGQQNRGGSRNKNQIKQKLDKFNSQGRDARQSGDRIAAENFFQHAEHYQRLLNEIEAAGGSKPAPAETNKNGHLPKDGNRIDPTNAPASEADMSVDDAAPEQNDTVVPDEVAAKAAKPKRRSRSPRAKTEAAE